MACVDRGARRRISLVAQQGAYHRSPGLSELCRCSFAGASKPPMCRIGAFGMPPSSNTSCQCARVSFCITSVMALLMAFLFSTVGIVLKRVFAIQDAREPLKGAAESPPAATTAVRALVGLIRHDCVHTGTALLGYRRKRRRDRSSRRSPSRKGRRLSCSPRRSVCWRTAATMPSAVHMPVPMSIMEVPTRKAVGHHLAVTFINPADACINGS